MKIPLSWLAETVDLPASTEDLVRALTMAGVEVERVATRGAPFDRVVVAQIVESAQHPNADRLSVCRVDDGSGALRQIVCGAKNYRAGDKVPLAQPGAVLPGDFRIKVGKLRGVESQGMLCSAKELGLAEDAEGLLILPPDTAVGTPISEVFKPETVIEIEVTPNRPDWLGMIGLARELGAITGAATRLPATGELPAARADVAVETAACGYYSARFIAGVKVGPSPGWMRERLESAGLRSINNVVDITNYVLLETGAPLHAFDAAKLRGDLRVRDARDGEEFLALDGKTYRLGPGRMVIADEESAVAIAGVMGGEVSGVTDATTDLWLEAAQFDPGSVRRTARALGISSDSSYRFERGVDPAAMLAASARAAALIAELAGGTPGELRASSAAVPSRAVAAIPLRHARLEGLMGRAIGEGEVSGILQRLGLRQTADGWVPPSWRPDLVREVDLIEEIVRIVGMDAIPARHQARFAAVSGPDRLADFAAGLRRRFAALGLHEARSLSLVPERPIGLAAAGIAPEALLRVKNPMIDEQVVLRPTLLHGLLEAVQTNFNHGAESVRLFEIGRVFAAGEKEESARLGLVLSGPKLGRSWRAGVGAAFDLFDLKALLESGLGVAPGFVREDRPGLALCLRVEIAGIAVGFAGQLPPAGARALDAAGPVLVAELALEPLHGVAGGMRSAFRGLAKYPAVVRDIALLAPDAVTHGEIVAAFAGAGEGLLAGVELFDVFADPSGEKVPPGHKSMAYSLTYRSSERTLTADEVGAAHDRVKRGLQGALPVRFRE